MNKRNCLLSCLAVICITVSSCAIRHVKYNQGGENIPQQPFYRQINDTVLDFHDQYASNYKPQQNVYYPYEHGYKQKINIHQAYNLMEGRIIDPMMATRKLGVRYQEDRLRQIVNMPLPFSAQDLFNCENCWLLYVPSEFNPSPNYNSVRIIGRGGKTISIKNLLKSGRYRHFFRTPFWIKDGGWNNFTKEPLMEGWRLIRLRYDDCGANARTHSYNVIAYREQIESPAFYAILAIMFSRQIVGKIVTNAEAYHGKRVYMEKIPGNAVVFQYIDDIINLEGLCRVVTKQPWQG